MIAIREPTSYEDETEGISDTSSRHGEMHDGLALAPADRIHAGEHVPTPQPLFTITLRARRYVMPQPLTPRDVPRERRDTSVRIAPNARMEPFGVNAGARRGWKLDRELGTCTCACGRGGADSGAGCSTLSIKSRHLLPRLFLSFFPWVRYAPRKLNISGQEWMAPAGHFSFSPGAFFLVEPNWGLYCTVVWR